MNPGGTNIFTLYMWYIAVHYRGKDSNYIETRSVIFRENCKKRKKELQKNHLVANAFVSYHLCLYLWRWQFLEVFKLTLISPLWWFIPLIAFFLFIFFYTSDGRLNVKVANQHDIDKKAQFHQKEIFAIDYF